MLRNVRMILVGALGVMLGVVAARPAAAQDGDQAPEWRLRPALEGFYTQLRLDGDGRSPSAEGIGGRLMWSPAVSGGALAPLANRTELGVYATYTPRRDVDPGLDFSSFGLGVAMDVLPFGAPLAGRVEPFVSVGAGVLHVGVDRTAAATPTPLLDRSSTMFTLNPGVGARLLLTPTVALQGDVRDVMTFVGDTRHNVAFGAGLRIGF